MRSIYLTAIALLFASLACCAQAKGKLAGNAGGGEREVAAYSASKGLEGWTITDPSGDFEFSLDPGEYMVSCAGRLVPYVRIEDNKTTYVSHSDDPKFDLPQELWTPACKSFGQTYVATGNGLGGAWFWMPQGSTVLKLTLREDGPEGRIIGEKTNDGKSDWFAGVGVPAKELPTTPGKAYYIEIASTEDIAWTIGMPKGPDPYDDGIAFFDGVPHPESDLGLSIGEEMPGLVTIAAAKADQHFIEKGPGSGSCVVAGQSFVGANGANVLWIYANCGFGGGATDFTYTIREGGPDGKVLASKIARMVSDWGSSVYFQPNEVPIKPGAQYYLEYKRVDGEKFYSYLSADEYPSGKAYRDGKEVEGFDQLFEIVGEVEPDGITYPYNVRVSDITSTGARITWDTGTPADGIIYFGEGMPVKESMVANSDLQKQHSVSLTSLKPGTVYYVRATSFTGKAGASRAWSSTESFLTTSDGPDSPRYDKPESPSDPSFDGAQDEEHERAQDGEHERVANGSFENGLKGWVRSSTANPKESKDFPIGCGPFGDAGPGTDGYKPHSGKMLYGWHHLGMEDPNPILPREDWKQEIISQKVSVKPGASYVLKALFLTGDRESGWGRDSRMRLVVDTRDSGTLGQFDSSSQPVATQWFATEHEWQPISLRFTAEKDTAVIGVHFLQWWALEANYLYVDDVTLEEIK